MNDRLCLERVMMEVGQCRGTAWCEILYRNTVSGWVVGGGWHVVMIPVSGGGRNTVKCRGFR